MSVAAHARSGESTTHALMDRWYAAWNAHDVAAVTACLTDDARLEEPDAPRGGHEGPEAIASWTTAWLIACPDLLLTEHDRWVTPDGSVIATWFTMRATFTGPLEPPGFAPTHYRATASGAPPTRLPFADDAARSRPKDTDGRR